ncbi:C-X-C motif chemokine 13 [Engystomops pustulosus]|uniref:C-X-C motif chemokine 13 n=1 Tax=Engystomops pustulosus TaxID=76066 RepID=UPI003AFA2004
MRSNFFFLWIILSLYCCFTTFGLWESRFVRRRCKCLKKTNELIHPEHFKNIIVLPETQNCRRKKIIIQLKNGYTVCVNTNAEWVGVEKQSEKVKKNRNFGY